MKVFQVSDPVFKTEPLFIVGCSFDQLSRYMKRRHWPSVGEDEGSIGTMFTFDRAPWRVIWVKKPDLALVMHEIFHLVTRICQDKGIPIKAHIENGDCGDEAAAYLFEHFARAALRRLV